MCEYGYMSAVCDGVCAWIRALSRFRDVALELEIPVFPAQRLVRAFFRKAHAKAFAGSRYVHPARSGIEKRITFTL